MPTLSMMVLFLVFLSAEKVQAHKVVLFAWVEEEMIHTLSQFGSKKKAVNCTVTLLDETGKVLQTGTTDENGNCSFKVPENIHSSLNVHLDAGHGHAADWQISEDELKQTTIEGMHQKKEEMKNQLDQGPSLYKIVSGIGLIFLLFSLLKWARRKKRQ